MNRDRRGAARSVCDRFAVLTALAFACLICVVPDPANAQISDFRPPGRIEVAEIAVLWQIERPVMKATLNDQGFLSFNEVPVHHPAWDLGRKCVGEESSCRINGASTAPIGRSPAILLEFRESVGNSLTAFVFRKHRKWINAVNESESGFTPGILVCDSYLSRTIRFWFGRETGISRTDPCSLCRDQRSLRILNLPYSSFRSLLSGIGGKLGGYSLVSNWIVGESHLANLSYDCSECQSKQYDRNPLAEFLFLVFALLFFTVGATLCFHGVNKSREIGGRRAVLWVIAGWLFFVPAVYAVFEQLL